MTNYNLENNSVNLAGTLDGDLKYSHSHLGESFYEGTIKINRLSSESDLIPFTISLVDIPKDLVNGSAIRIIGQFRSYNKIVEEKSRLILSVFVYNLTVLHGFDTAPNENYIMLKGYLCQPPIYRTTPFNREISDMLIAVNRSFNKSDYIPCITWGRNARFVKELVTVGHQIKVEGRIQSRKYNKKISDTEFITKTAYEVSVSIINNL